jgi:hypothetical protein
MACNTKIMMGVLALGLGTLANAQTFTFDTPVTTGNSQAAGTWYTDRYAPAGFTAPVSFMGDNRLKQTISSADAQTVPNQFYNTQGRKYDLDAGTNSMSIDLFIPTAWGTNGERGAGFWGTAFDGTNNISAYPIIEFTSNTAADGSGARFRAYNVNDGTWNSLGLPTGFTYDQFYKLNISLSGTNVNYSVGDKSWAVDSGGSLSISNVILQGYNTQAGRDYDIYWDNFQAVPEPSSIAAIGLGVLAIARRRRAKKA